MTLTLRTTRRVYQQSPAGSPDGTLTNALVRETGSNGEFRTGSEAERQRLYVSGQFTPAADYLGRIVSCTGTPPTSGTAGTNKHDYTWWRIAEVDGSGNWVRLEGFRAEDAGTGINWTIHASVDFAAASAAFAVDEGPLGPNVPPYPATRANTGPTVGQGIFFPGAANDILAAQPFFVGALGPGGTATATNARLVDFTGRFATLPTGSTLRWILRDLPAYTEEMFFNTIKRFLLECGWELYQDRGKNNGTGAGRFIARDAVFLSNGEDNRKEGYMRMIAVNDGGSADGSNSLDNTPRKGLDFAMFGAWDRDFVNAAGINPGNGINVCSPHNNATNRWASAADTVGTTANQPPFVNPNMTNASNGSIIGRFVGWSSRFHADSTKRFARQNALGTVEGGDLVEIHYTFVGDRDEVHLHAEASGFGSMYIGFGFMKPRADANGLIYTTNFSTAAGANAVLRIGGEPGNPTSDGIDPTSPGGGLVPYAIGDQIQIAGKTVNAGIVAGTSHSGEFITDAQIIAFPGLLPAVGSITVPSGGSISDGDTIAISDGTTTVTFEFDDNASVVGGNVAVTFTSGDTAATVASALDTAINGSVLNITSTPTSNVLSLVSGLSGSGVGAGNVPFVTSLTNSGSWTLEGMSGGGYSIQVDDNPTFKAAGAKAGEDPDPIFIYAHNKANIRNSALEVQPFTQDSAFITNNAAGFNNGTYYSGSLPSGTNTARGFQGFECFGSLETVDNLNEVAPNRRGGRHIAIPVVCRDQEGAQLRGTLRYLRFISARIRDHKFVRDRNLAYHYIAPSYLQEALNGEQTPASGLSANFMFGPLPSAHVII